MNYHTLAVSALALGLLAPVGAMAHNTNCSEDQMNRKEFIDCNTTAGTVSEQFGAAVVTDDRVDTKERQTRHNLGDSTNSNDD